MASGQPPGTDPLQPWAKTNTPVNVMSGNIEQGRNDIKIAGSDDTRRAPTMVYTEEERAVLKECERESFYLRALPFAMGCMVGVQALAKSGRLALHPKFGSIPKTIIGGGFGYFFGKISYMSQCQQKVLDKIPNSNLAVIIRKSRGIKEEDTSKEESWEHAPSNRLRDEYNSMDSPTRDEAPSNPSLGLDDTFRPSVDREGETSKAPQEKPFTSYEDLRRRNRNQYDGRTVPSTQPPGSPTYEDRLRDKSESQQKSPAFDESPSSSISQDPPKKKRTNVWGDPIDD